MSSGRNSEVVGSYLSEVGQMPQASQQAQRILGLYRERLRYRFFFSNYGKRR